MTTSNETEFPIGVVCPHDECGAKNSHDFENVRRIGPEDFECRCCGTVFSADDEETANDHK